MTSRRLDRERLRGRLSISPLWTDAFEPDLGPQVRARPPRARGPSHESTQTSTSPHVHGIHTVHRCTRWCANALGYTKKRLRRACTRSCTPSPALDAVVKEGRALSEDASATRAGRRVLSPVARLGSRSRLGPGAGPGGPVDTGLAPGNVLIPAEADTANGLPQDPVTPALDRARAASRRPRAHSHDLTVGPGGAKSRPAAEMVCTIVCMRFTGAFLVAKRGCAPSCALMNGVDAMHVRRRGMRALALERPPVAR
jgi:hypothetical protein